MRTSKGNRGISPARQLIPPELGRLSPADYTIPKLLALQAERNRDRPLLLGTGRSLTYKGVWQSACMWAGRLRQAGVARGDRVAIMSAHRAEAIEVLLGCAHLGATAVMVNNVLRGAQLHHVVETSQPKLLITELESFGELSNIGLKAGVLVLGDPPEQDLAVEPAAVQPGEPLVVIFSSGSTGMPKGVVCSHAQFFWWGVNTGWNLGVSSDDLLYTALPLHHTNAISTFMQALVFGSTCEIGPRFSSSRMWQRLADSGATVTYLLGAMVAMLLSQPLSDTDRSHRVRAALAPATPSSLHTAFEQRFGVELLEAYGSTETNHVLGAKLGKQRLGSMGRVLPGFEARAADSQDQTVPDGRPGQLLLRNQEPYSFFNGYLGMSDRTVEVCSNLWYHTGDTVVRDRDGFFRFLDRDVDVIRRRGENISSLEVEAAILSHPAVAAAAAYGVPSELAEDEVMATVVLRDGMTFDPDSLIVHCLSRLPRHAVPRYIALADRLPLTDNGKVQKRELRALGITELTWDGEAGLRRR